MNLRKFLQWAATIYLWQLMILSAVIFNAVEGNGVFETLYQKTGLYITGQAFVLGCVFGALIAPLIMLLPDSEYTWRWSLYVFAAFPLLVYCVPLAIWYVVNRTFNIAIVIYLDVFFSFFLIGGSVFRPRKI